MRRRVGRFLAVAVVLDVAVVAAVFGAEAMRLTANASRMSSLPGLMGGPGNRYTFLSEHALPIDRPETTPASQAKLKDEEQVFGVEVRGKFRAYRTSALSTPMTHIVNDWIDGVAVSITYCNESKCLRAFTDPASPHPLNLNSAGKLLMEKSEMLLDVNGKYYFQASLKSANMQTSVPFFPYALYPVETSTWKDWRDQHPETDVYEGDHSVDVGWSPSA